MMLILSFRADRRLQGSDRRISPAITLFPDTMPPSGRAPGILQVEQRGSGNGGGGSQ